MAEMDDIKMTNLLVKHKPQMKNVTMKKVNDNRRKCRLCLVNKGVIPIFNKSSDTTIANHIYAVTSIQIVETDEGTKFICGRCVTSLKSCMEFISMCQKNKFISKKNIKNPSKPQKCEYQHFASVENEECVNIEVETDDEAGQEHHGDSEPSEMKVDYDPNCKECLKSFDNKEELLKHLPCKELGTKGKTRADPEKALCDICGKTLYSINYVKEHRRLHVDAFPFKCDQCDYMGKSQALLNVHVRSHLPESERPFKCAQCPKAVVTSSALQTHVRRTHSNERPFKGCQNTSESLKPSTSTNYDTMCNLCEKPFKLKADLKWHINVTHHRLETVVCHICNSPFSQKKHLRRHLWQMHKLKSQRTLPNRLSSYMQHKLASSDTIVVESVVSA